MTEAEKTAQKAAHGDNNGYLARYKNRTLDIWARSLSAAKDEAVKQFKARHSWDVSVSLCVRADGTEVMGTI